MLYRLAFFISFLFIIRAGCNYFMNYWGHVMGARMEKAMRKDLFDHYLTLSYKFYDENKTGKLMSRLVNDLRDISEMAHHAPEDGFISVLMLVGSLGLLMTINVQLTLVLALMVVILLVFSIFKRKSMLVAFRNQRERTANINAQIENSISGIRLCQSYVNESFEREKFEVVNQKHYESLQQAYKAMGEFTAGTHFLADLMNLAIVVVGGIFTIQGWINIGDLVAYLLFTSFFMRPIRQVIGMIQQIQSGMTGFERFYEIMNLDSDIKECEHPQKNKSIQGNITFNAVDFQYDEGKPILNKLTLDISKGKHVALVGPSGVGKSTIINLIPRFYDTTGGSIQIDGVDIKQMDLAQLRRAIGIVQQDVFIFHGTIRDNIVYGNPDASEESIINAAKNAFIHDFIINLPDGYNTMVGERGVKLSGGQKQRLSIARVFLKNPPIIILDEATSSLDNASERYVQMALDRLSQGKTTVTVAHRLTTVMHADEILVLEGNSIVERGTHDALLNQQGLYSKLYHAQFKGFIPDSADEDSVTRVV
jgi:ATP-binding cassette, subfamily B, bacterial